MESRVVLYVLYHVTLNMYLRLGVQRESEVSLHRPIFLFRKIILRSRIKVQESHQFNT